MSQVDCEHYRLPMIGENPNYLSAFSDIATGYKAMYQCYKYLAGNQSLLQYISKRTVTEFHELPSFTQLEISTVLLLIIFWFAFRYIIVKCASTFARKNWTGISDETVGKLGESCYKTLAYSILWSLALFVTFFSGNTFFQNTIQIFNHEMNEGIDLKVCYAMEVAFYFQAFIATLFFDVRKKDDMAMILHHIVTIGLITFSYKIEMYAIGLVIFVLDDLNDIFLEMGKIFTYINLTDQFHQSKSVKLASDICAVCFVLVWIVNRLYFHVTKVWRPAAYGGFSSSKWQLPTRFTLVLNAMVMFLYVFYWYWFFFIIKFIYRLIVLKKTKDPREKED